MMSSNNKKSENTQVIAVPIADGLLCMHFGHCEQFALLEVDTVGKEILNIRHLTPPPHEPGLLPRWLNEQGASIVIAGGMGQRAQNIFAGEGIQVIVGAPAALPEIVAQAFLDGKLQTGNNLCDH